MAGRMASMTVFMVMLTLVMAVSGITLDNGDTGTVVSKFGFSINETNGNLIANSNNDVNTSFFGTATGALGWLILAGAGAIVTGFLLNLKVENYVVLTIIVGLFATFTATWYGFITYFGNSASWISWAAYGLFIPITVLYLITLVEYFRGNV